MKSKHRSLSLTSNFILILYCELLTRTSNDDQRVVNRVVKRGSRKSVFCCTWQKTSPTVVTNGTVNFFPGSPARPFSLRQTCSFKDRAACREISCQPDLVPSNRTCVEIFASVSRHLNCLFGGSCEHHFFILLLFLLLVLVSISRTCEVVFEYHKRRSPPRGDLVSQVSLQCSLFQLLINLI